MSPVGVVLGTASVARHTRCKQVKYLCWSKDHCMHQSFSTGAFKQHYIICMTRCDQNKFEFYLPVDSGDMADVTLTVALTSAALSTRSLTTSVCPLFAAHISEVNPFCRASAEEHHKPPKAPHMTKAESGTATLS